MNQLLTIRPDDLAVVNRILEAPDNALVKDLQSLVDKFGGVEKINAAARAARQPDSLMARLREMNSSYVADLKWLQDKAETKAFIPLNDYAAGLFDKGADLSFLKAGNAVTLEISALQFFPWLMAQARQALAQKELMPGRFIRVRNMAEQVKDNGDILATALAMQILGATYVESLDTRGTDGSNIHLAGGPETITGFFGGIGQPNGHVLKWTEELLFYYTEYGIQEVLNINAGTILAGYFLFRMGLDIRFKISVFVGNDNPFFIFWTLMTARLFAREDGSTPLAGFNLSNSVDNETIRQAAVLRKDLGLEDQVRFEHHITETCKSIVAQPYNRREELVDIAKTVPNISAKHEGGEPEIEATRNHPTDIFDYFLSREDIMAQGLMPDLELNYLDKHHSVNLTAQALIKSGTGVIPAANLHLQP